MPEPQVVLPGRNNGLDFLRLVCIFLVLCIHFPFQNESWILWVNVGRIAVPFFFMLTGYHYRHLIEKNRQKQQIIKTLKIFVVSLLICGSYGLIRACFTNGMTEYLSHFTWNNFRDLILFNNITLPYSWHL